MGLSPEVCLRLDSIVSRILFSKLFSILCRGGPMCPPYFFAHTQVRPYENIENYTWDNTLEAIAKPGMPLHRSF